VVAFSRWKWSTSLRRIANIEYAALRPFRVAFQNQAWRAKLVCDRTNQLYVPQFTSLLYGGVFLLGELIEATDSPTSYSAAVGCEGAVFETRKRRWFRVGEFFYCP
jgi:hypothetical protein